MFGIGVPELILILVLALVLLGPQKLPEVAKSLGRGMRELRKASDDLRETFVDDYRNFLEDEKKPADAPGADAAAAAMGSGAPGAAATHDSPLRRDPPPGAVATLDQLGATALSVGVASAPGSAVGSTVAPLAGSPFPPLPPVAVGTAHDAGWPAPPEPPLEAEAWADPYGDARLDDEAMIAETAHQGEPALASSTSRPAGTPPASPPPGLPGGQRGGSAT